MVPLAPLAQGGGSRDKQALQALLHPRQGDATSTSMCACLRPSLAFDTPCRGCNKSCACLSRPPQVGRKVRTRVRVLGG